MIALVLAGLLLAGPADHTPPCVNDEPVEGSRCVWDARHQGNGLGHSFVARADGTVVRVTHARAHLLATTPA